jgi:hypothetical protein
MSSIQVGHAYKQIYRIIVKCSIKIIVIVLASCKELSQTLKLNITFENVLASQKPLIVYDES